MINKNDLWKKTYIFLYGFILYTFSCMAFAETRLNQYLSQLAKELPADLVYQRYPIDAACIQEMINASHDKPIYLSTCTKGIKKDKISRTYDHKRLDDAFIGYDTEQESNYYKWLGDLEEHHHLLYAEYSGGVAAGGAGVFSELIIMQRSHDTIKKVTLIAGGDREANGIERFNYKAGKLNWSQYVTPEDVFKLGLSLSDLVQKTDEYEGLEYCPLCGAAIAEFETTDFKNKTFLNLEFTTDNIEKINIQELQQKPEKTIQDCFDLIRMRYIEEGKIRLNPEQLKEFVREVITLLSPQKNNPEIEQ